MLWIVQFLQKRPSDKAIRLTRIVFGLILISSLYYNLIFLWKNVDVTFFDFSFFGFVLTQGFTLWETGALIFKYILVSLGLIPLIKWVTDICLIKQKYIRIFQIIFAIVLFYIAGIIEESPTLDIDVLIWLMWILPLLAGITGKATTKKCLNYWEKITKIRV